MENHTMGWGGTCWVEGQVLSEQRQWWPLRRGCLSRHGREEEEEEGRRSQ